MLSGLRHATRLTRSARHLAQFHDRWPAELGAPPIWLSWAARLARLKKTRHETPKSLVATIEALGPAYIKLGQLLATRPDIVGSSLAGELAALQDRLPPFAPALAQDIVERELGQPVSSLFAAFGPCIAAASIAQVHKATASPLIGHNRPPFLSEPANDLSADIPKPVAVKLLRPGIEKAFTRDLDSFFWAAGLAEHYWPPARRLEPVKLVQTLADSVALELDLRLEASAAVEMGRHIANDDDFRVPWVDWSRTGQRVLTTEWIDGIPIGERVRLVASGHDPGILATKLMRAFLKHALRDGFFHADMHQGNLFVDAQGRIVAVDFGIMGRLDAPARRYLAEILMGFITRDYKRVADVHFEAGYVSARYRQDDFAQALRAIGEPIFGRPAGDISMARLFSQLFETTRLFDMHLRPELVMLQKTMVAVEGVARHLDPDHNIWEAARPVVEAFLARELGPEGQLQSAADHARAMGRILSGLPAFLSTIEHAARLYADKGLKLDTTSVEAVTQANRRARRAEYWALAATALAVLTLLWSWL